MINETFKINKKNMFLCQLIVDFFHFIIKWSIIVWFITYTIFSYTTFAFDFWNHQLLVQITQLLISSSLSSIKLSSTILLKYILFKCIFINIRPKLHHHWKDINRNTMKIIVISKKNSCCCTFVSLNFFYSYFLVIHFIIHHPMSSSLIKQVYTISSPYFFSFISFSNLLVNLLKDCQYLKARLLCCLQCAHQARKAVQLLLVSCLYWR